MRLPTPHNLNVEPLEKAIRRDCVDWKLRSLHRAQRRAGTYSGILVAKCAFRSASLALMRAGNDF